MNPQMGPELDSLLQNLTEDLKGKTQLDEPYVSNQTLICAVRHQNTILQSMNTAICDLVEKIASIGNEYAAQKIQINVLQDKVNFFQKYIEKVNNIENLLNSWREKITLVQVHKEKLKVRHVFRINF